MSQALASRSPSVLPEAVAVDLGSGWTKVWAAAIAVGSACGSLAVADIGAELTEVALLADGVILAARRAEVGTRDLTRGLSPARHADIVAEPMSRGLVLAGDGAATPDLTAQLARRVKAVVRCAGSPHRAGLTGAGLAALAATRHPGATG